MSIGSINPFRFTRPQQATPGSENKGAAAAARAGIQDAYAPAARDLDSASKKVERITRGARQLSDSLQSKRDMVTGPVDLGDPGKRPLPGQPRPAMTGPLRPLTGPISFPGAGINAPVAGAPISSKDWQA